MTQHLYLWDKCTQRRLFVKGMALLKIMGGCETRKLWKSPDHMKIFS